MRRVELSCACPPHITSVLRPPVLPHPGLLSGREELVPGDATAGDDHGVAGIRCERVGKEDREMVATGEVADSHRTRRLGADGYRGSELVHPNQVDSQLSAEAQVLSQGLSAVTPSLCKVDRVHSARA